MMILKMAKTMEHRYKAPASIYHLAPRSSQGLPWLAGPITWAPGSLPASSCDRHYGRTAICYVQHIVCSDDACSHLTDSTVT